MAKEEERVVLEVWDSVRKSYRSQKASSSVRKYRV